MMYYQVYLEKHKGLYTYVDTKEEFQIGESVYVFFRGKKQLAYIIARDIRTEYEFQVLPILAKTTFPDLPPSLIELVRWMVRYYITSYEAVLKNVLPRGLKVKKQVVYSLGEKILEAPEELLSFWKKETSVTKATLRKMESLEEIKHSLQEGLLLELEQGKFLWNPEKEKEGILGEYFKTREEFPLLKLEKSFSKKKIEEFLENDFLCSKEYFVNLLQEKEIAEESAWISQNIQLNEEQEEVFQNIIRGKDRFYLLKGVTGSGKTEVYLSLIREAFFRGKGSIFLVPEISLTPQMIQRFQNEFQGNIAILHSRMTAKERAEEWYHLYTGKKKIVLGVRSAIFAPVKDLEYIIIDEEHESSYKQDTNPRYHAKQVALKRAMLEGAKVVLGSATPSVESYYYAKVGLYHYLELTNRYNNAKMPQIVLVDMREEDDIFFSQTLLEEMRESLLRKEQVLLLLNRKGYSTYIQCQDCGHVEECSHCSIKMSYYGSQGVYKCNYCGKTVKYTGHCSQCGSEKLVHSGKGIERIEEELKQYFPSISVLRVDGDQRGSHFFETAYEDFKNQKYQVMIGTQIIAKGLHFPNVTLVGVINADMILNFPDFRAGEKTYQLLTQVAGRAGREEKEGKVVIQTYQPENYVIEKVQKDAYEEFYEKEEEAREFLEYPPFSKMILLTLSSTDEEFLKEKVKEIASNIQNTNLEIYGPLPSLIYKVKDRYRYQIFMKGMREEIESYKKELRKKLSPYQTEEKLRIGIDVDPLNMI